MRIRALAVGKLRVTLRHNLFADLGQRAPRVRFGQIGVYSAIYAENNAFE